MHLHRPFPQYQVLLTAPHAFSVSNAYTHGSESGLVKLNASTDGNKLVIELRNEAGANHAKGLALQAEVGSITSTIAAQNNMGSAESTYLGSKEIQQATAAMGASTELRFEESSVLFRLTMDLQEASPLEIDSALPPLPTTMRLICAGTPCSCMPGTLIAVCILLLLPEPPYHTQMMTLGHVWGLKAFGLSWALRKKTA